jgi:hypothetical protein
LDWLNKEQEKDSSELQRDKDKFAKQLMAMRKEQLFEKEKPSLWKKIQKLLWGS